MSGILQFVLGMKDDGFTATGAKASETMGRLTSQTHSVSAGLAETGRNAIDSRGKVEILRQTLASAGGSFSALGGLARLALDPATLGFAAVFAALDLWSGHIEKVAHDWEVFQKQASMGSAIIKGILGERPTLNQDWIKLMTVMAKISEKPVDISTGPDNAAELVKQQDANSQAAGQAQLAIEEQKITLLQTQGRISAQDAAARIAALQNEFALQKDMAEQKAIQHQIDLTKKELGDLGNAPDPKSAQQAKIAADDKVALLEDQVNKTQNAMAEEDRTMALAKSEQGKQFTPLKTAISGAAVGAVPGLGILGSLYFGHEAKKNYDSFGEQGEAAQKQKSLDQANYTKARQDLPGAIDAQKTANENAAAAPAQYARAEEQRKKLAGLETQLAAARDKQAKLTPGEIEKNNLAARQKSAEELRTEGAKAKPEYTSFEKMGFVMGGATNPMLDATRKQTDATQKLTTALTNIAKVLNPGGAGAATANAI